LYYLLVLAWLNHLGRAREACGACHWRRKFVQRFIREISKKETVWDS